MRKLDKWSCASQTGFARVLYASGGLTFAEVRRSPPPYLSLLA